MEQSVQVARSNGCWSQGSKYLSPFYLIAIIFQSELNVKCITFPCINKFMSGKKVLNVILHIGSMNPIILGCQLNVSTLDWGGKKKKRP